MTSRKVVLDGGSPWGFRMYGGVDVQQPLRVSRVNSGSKAVFAGLREGDIVTSINGHSTKAITYSEAHGLLKSSGNTLTLGLNEDVASPKQRKQNKGVVYEERIETVKQSNRTTKTVSSSKILELEENSEPIDYNYDRSDEYNSPNRDHLKTFDSPPLSPISSISSDVSTPSTLTEVGGNDNGASVHASRLLSKLSIRENKQLKVEQIDDAMPDHVSSKSKRKRNRNQRKKNKKSSSESSAPSNEEPSTSSVPTEENNAPVTIENKQEVTSSITVQPEEAKKSSSSSKPIKSRSLDDLDAISIQELSETSENEERIEDRGIITEAESDNETKDQICGITQPATILSSTSLPIIEISPYLEEHVSAEEELSLRNFLHSLNLVNSTEESSRQATIESVRSSKARKKQALEQYFLPYLDNPRFLDIISEEGSDLSDRENALIKHQKRGTPEELKHMTENTKKLEKKNRSSFPELILVNTKLVDTPKIIIETVHTYTEENAEAETVYLDDSSSGSVSPYQSTESAKTILNELKEIDRELSLCKDEIEETHQYELNQLTPPLTPKNSPKGETTPVEEELTEDSINSEMLEVLNQGEGIKRGEEEEIDFDNISTKSCSSSSSNSSRSNSPSTIKINPLNSSSGDVMSLQTDLQLVDVASQFLEPLTLQKLCLNFFMSLPSGSEILEEISNVSRSIKEFTDTLNSTHTYTSSSVPAFVSTSFRNINCDVIKLLKTKHSHKDAKSNLNIDMTKIKNSLENTNALVGEPKISFDFNEDVQHREENKESEKRIHLENTVQITSIKLVNGKNSDEGKNIENDSKTENDDMKDFNSINLVQRYVDTNKARLRANSLYEWLELARGNENISLPPEEGILLTKHDNVEKQRSTNNQTGINVSRQKSRRASLPNEIYQRQMQFILEKEQQIQNELERLEEEKRKLYADMTPNKTKELSDKLDGEYQCHTENFRKQMYQEYMNEVAAREDRKQHKVIKISSSPKANFSEEIPICCEVLHLSGIEDEFMKKVHEKQVNNADESDENEDHTTKIEAEMSEPVLVMDKGCLKEASQLPKHLQEFVEIANDAAEDLEIFLADADSKKDLGVWAPGQQREFAPADIKNHQRFAKEEDEPPIIPVWTPKSANSSPTIERKEFRPVNFESPKLERKNKQPIEVVNFSSSAFVKPHRQVSQPDTINRSAGTAVSSANPQNRLPISRSTPSVGFNGLSLSTPRLPRAQNPTITLLQKAREGQLPRGAYYIDQDQYQYQPQFRNPHYGPSETVYHIKNDYTSESENEYSKKMPHRKVEGIGPTTKGGLPLTLRSEIREANQSKWYKKMYDTIHKQKPYKDEYVTVNYKQRRAQYPYVSGYFSEPDPSAYDSDFTENKYATLDRRRTPLSQKENISVPPSTASLPRPRTYVPIKSSSSTDIINQKMALHPGRIENYTPGHSSIQDQESNQWWDEVMDIFNGHFEQEKRIVVPPRSFLNQALKESGYESDSTLVFKKKDDVVSQLSPLEQKEAYKTIQKGGDVPLHGLRKPAPERPKESPRKYVENQVTIHYKTPVRQEIKEYFSEDELAHRQAETMKKIYQEDRRRKYVQELQDMNNRRHTDNFIPSEKSPIALNRYDDFDNLAAPAKIRPRSPEPRLIAKALYNFVGHSSRELTFRKGDLIYVRKQIDKNWFEGELNAMIGLFPVNYVEIVPHDVVKITTPKKAHEGQARAKFHFVAKTSLELSLAKGELVVITRRVDNNWFEGKLGGRKGIFPVAYVDVLTDPSDPPPVSAKPVASPAAHSMLLNGSAGGKQSMGSHNYAPNSPSQHLATSYHAKPVQVLGSDAYGSASGGFIRKPIDQALHIDTQPEPVPYKALYKYTPQNDDELELLEGDKVYVLEKCDDGWYVGSSDRTGAFGTFPGNYVEKA